MDTNLQYYLGIAAMYCTFIGFAIKWCQKGGTDNHTDHGKWVSMKLKATIL